jgi:NodT family efflux transporter outer membrane factor (OMF) lipoprotein
MRYFALALPLIMACTAPRVSHPELGVSTPEEWAGLIQTSSDSKWWNNFNDPVLDALIEEAQGNNHNLKAAATRVRAAAAQAKIAGAPLQPQVSGRLGASRRKQNFIGFPIPGGSNGVASSTSSNFGVSLDVSWELDLWGRLGAAKSAALSDFQAARADHSGARLSLAGQTAKAWFAAIEAHRQKELAEATVQNFTTSSELVRTRYQRGLRPSLDLRLSLSILSNAEANLAQRGLLLDRSTRQLEILLGRYPGAQLDVASDLPEIPSQVPGEIPANLVSRRPDLVAAERRVAAALARTKQAKRSLYPRISLSSSAGTSSSDLNHLLNGDYSVWNLAANLIQPMLQGGRIRGSIEFARAKDQQSLALYVQTALNAFAEVESALSAEGYLESREASLVVATEQSLAARRLAEERYASGLSDLITLLDAQRRAYESESQLLAVRRQRLENRIDLHLALGGGYRGVSMEQVDAQNNHGAEAQ